MGGARRESRRKAVLFALALALRLPPGKILTVIKCSLVTIHIPRCDLLNAIFAR